MDYRSYEPPPKDDDTRPTMTMPAVKTGGGWRGVVGLLSLLAALGFMMGTVALVVTAPDSETVIIQPTPGPTSDAIIEIQPTATEELVISTAPAIDPTATDAPSDPDGETVMGSAQLQPLSPAAEESLLNQPLEDRSIADVAMLSREQLDPFTIIPDRPREGMEEYAVVQGDTIDDIALRFNLQPETIAWSNPRQYVQLLRTGVTLNIPPEDGVYIAAQGQIDTLADYAARYEVSVEAIVNHEVNRAIAGMSADTIPPSGTTIFFPGGQGEDIVWQAEILVENSGGSSGVGGGGGGTPTVRFQPGDPGDCGAVPIGGGTLWTNPVPSGYQITQGFAPIAHPGIDLAAGEGTPIVAANGGYVIFAGWNSYGYGNMVALIHGPNMTVYGHMQNGSITVGCGQWVDAGQRIGGMGCTGRCSGTHLHFEIRGGPAYSPLSPSGTIPF